MPLEGENKVDIFKKMEVRKVLHNGEWWFVVNDVIAAVAQTPDPAGYLKKMRARDESFGEGWGQLVTPLPFKTTGGIQNVNCVTIEGIFRILQSVPSPRAEPFKKWLAKVGFERLQEIQNPELAIKRAIALYRAKGYDDEWIDARIRNKASRELLTSEWDKRGMKEYIAYLTDAISVGTFGIRTAVHKKMKGLSGQSLRDNMTPIELTLTTLGEQATREITKSTNPQNLQEHMGAASQGGRIAGHARVNIERATGKPVVSNQNYLTDRQRANNAQTHKGLSQMLQSLLEFEPKKKDNQQP